MPDIQKNGSLDSPHVQGYPSSEQIMSRKMQSYLLFIYTQHDSLVAKTTYLNASEDNRI